MPELSISWTYPTEIHSATKGESHMKSRHTGIREMYQMLREHTANTYEHYNAPILVTNESNTVDGTELSGED